YRAKSDGRGTFRFFEPVMDLQMQTRRIMEQDLRKALPSGEFELHYQPVVNLASKEISGFEALIRWNHPSKGMISPADFIPLAEEIGFSSRWASGSSGRPAPPPRNGPTSFTSPSIFRRSSF